MGREGTPDGRQTGRPPTTGDATMASGVSCAGNGNGNATGARLRRGSTSYDDHRNSFSSITSLNAANSMYGSMYGHANANANGSPSAAFRRRSSNFSDFSQDARDLLNPKPLGGASESLRHHQPTSSWDSLPLAFALLPAVGGLLVQGGGSFVTDLMLLCLGGIFLHWSVTQPWTWYHSSQQIREEHEATAEFAVQAESDEEAEDDGIGVDQGARSPSPAPLGNLDEEEEGGDSKGDDDDNEDTDSTERAKKRAANAKKPLTPDERVAAYHKKQREKRRQERRTFQTRQEAALRELYRHEVLALLACFVFPVLGAFLLHALRSQLTRPSEGLISDFNLTVFILAAEVRPLRHFLQLVQARTLHLQRVVHANPYREEEERYRERRAQEEQEQNQVLSELLGRFESLEQQTMAASAAAATKAASSSNQAQPANPHHNLSSSSSATSYFSSATSPTSPPSPPSTSPKPLRRSPSESKRDRDQLLREVRAQLQPELDTLARALRRTHKQQAMLETQVVAKFRATDQRLSDAVSLASAAASGGRSGRGRLFINSFFPSPSAVHLLDVVWTTMLWAFEAAVAALLYLPRRFTAAAASVLTFPLWVVQAISGGWGEDGGRKGGKARSRGSKSNRKEASIPSSAPIFVIDEHLTSGNVAGLDAGSIRDLDYEYAAVSSSGMRSRQMGSAT
ncbi:hypothetical protein SCUCBS95973_003046 [Sporothrix curviconia]|uniref:Proteophosphoglycan ppg4 n=1 Tax=Sporothrix curviconia TaxID=1260050 RepID=A0ABP0BD22_9PEZI